MKSDIDVQNGDLVRDTITGLEGIVVCRSEWLNGCVRITIQPKKLSEKGVPVEPSTVDIEQVKMVKKRAHFQCDPSGGPMPAPKRTGR